MNRRQFLQSSAATPGITAAGLDAAELPAAARRKREGEFDYLYFYRSPDFTVEKWWERNRKRG